MTQKKKLLVIIGVVILMIVIIAIFYFQKSSQEIIGISQEGGKIFNFTQAKVCTVDSECALVHKGIICPFCDRPECKAVDFLSNDYLAINFQILSEWRNNNCPSKEECIAKYGLVPDCPIKLETTNEKVATKCIKNTCQKVIIAEKE